MDAKTSTICTIATASYQRQAACMLDSFLRHHPNGRCYILHVDDAPPEPLLDRPEIVRLLLADVGVPDLDAMRSRYTLFEFCNALKPFLLGHLLNALGHERVCYFDGDIYFFASLQTEVWDELEKCSILLTPHLSRLPSTDHDLIWRDLAVLQHGVYNGGFIGLRRGPDAERFLNWWGDRTRLLGQKKLEEGLNCDQRWLDLLPGFDLNWRISRHPGLNAAYWNLHERAFSQQGDRFLVNGHPLLFFHFSGYSHDQPESITLHYTHFDFSSRPDLQPIFAAYQQALLTASPTRPAGPFAPSRFATSRPFAPSWSETTSTPTPDPLNLNLNLAVSVIIPARDAAAYLSEAISSVLAQTGVAAEIVVIDDGSEDDTAQVAASFGERVRLLQQAQPGGVSAARNQGIAASRGQYVAFLDADDWYLAPDKLAKQAAILAARPEVGIVHSGWRVVDEGGSLLSERRPWQHAPELDLRGWLLWQAALPSAMMVRRKALIEVGGFDPTLAHLEDIDLALRITRAGYATAWLEEVTVAYRQHQTNATRRLAETEIDLQRVLRNFFAQPDLPAEIRQIAAPARFGALQWLALQYLRAQSYADMARVLRTALPSAGSSSPGAALMAWLDYVAHVSRQHYGERLDVYALTSRPEWQALVQSHVIGQAPDQPLGREGALAQSRPWPAAPARSYSTLVVTKGASVESDPGAAVSAPPKLNLATALGRDYGRHRSGWTFALRSLLPLHTDDGIFVDAFPEHTFGNPGPVQRQPHQQPWVGCLHNPPHMPEWFFHSQSPQSLLANEAFRASLPFCLGFFCLSDYHRTWLEERLEQPIVTLRFATFTPDIVFSLQRFVANPRKRIVQIGSWLRRLHSIYYLPVARLHRAIVHQHRPYIEDLFARERAVYKLRPDETGVERLPFLADDQYDELLASNLVYLDLYDSSANNVIVECLVRATPVLVNPLPAVVEYLGRDYPFYFNSRSQAAAKAESMALIEQTHHYLLERPLRSQLSAEAFVQAVATSSLYRSLPGAPRQERQP